MKKLIVGVFIVQIAILVALGIPVGGAANGVWKDPQSGIVVRQDNPVNTVKSYYNLLEHESYDFAVLLFEQMIRDNVNGDVLRASEEQGGLVDAQLVKITSSTVIDNYAVAALIRLPKDTPEQPAMSLITLREIEGKWEITQDMSNTEITEIKLVFERALEVCLQVLKDPFPTLTEEQKNNLYMQAQMGGQYIAGNLAQINEMIESQ